MIKGIAHVCLASPDLATTERFYCEVLGLKKAFDFIRAGRVIGFYLEVRPGVFIEVFQRGDVDAAATAPLQHLCLEVEDIGEVGRRLAASGFKVTEKTLGADHSWQMWTTDPGGVRIEFHQYTDRSCQITGENCQLS